MALTVRLSDEQAAELNKIGADLGISTNAGTIKTMIEQFLPMKEELQKTKAELKERKNSLQSLKRLSVLMNEAKNNFSNKIGSLD